MGETIYVIFNIQFDFALEVWFSIVFCYMTEDIVRINLNMSKCMRFPTMWYVRPAKAQTSLRIRAV